MCGQYYGRTEQPPVDMKQTYGWLKSLNLPTATRRTGCCCSRQSFSDLV